MSVNTAAWSREFRALLVITDRMHDAYAMYTGLIRFIPRSSTRPVIGQPSDANQDVGLASRKGDEIKAEVFDGYSVLQPGKPTGKFETVERLLSPLAGSEVGTIRCIGLNVCSRKSSPTHSWVVEGASPSIKNTQRKRNSQFHQCQYSSCSCSSSFYH